MNDFLLLSFLEGHLQVNLPGKLSGDWTVSSCDHLFVSRVAVAAVRVAGAVHED